MKHGTELPQSKLTDIEVQGMRRLHELGTPVIDLARFFQISRIHVWRIVKRKAWKHVE